MRSRRRSASGRCVRPARSLRGRPWPRRCSGVPRSRGRTRGRRGRPVRGRCRVRWPRSAPAPPPARAPGPSPTGAGSSRAAPSSGGAGRSCRGRAACRSGLPRAEPGARSERSARFSCSGPPDPFPTAACRRACACPHGWTGAGRPRSPRTPLAQPLTDPSRGPQPTTPKEVLTSREAAVNEPVRCRRACKNPTAGDGGCTSDRVQPKRNKAAGAAGGHCSAALRRCDRDHVRRCVTRAGGRRRSRASATGRTETRTRAEADTRAISPVSEHPEWSSRYGELPRRRRGSRAGRCRPRWIHRVCGSWH